MPGFEASATPTDSFLLNDQPYYLRLVLGQGYWPESHLAAPSPDALRREVELIKELGFNGVRVHQKVEDPRFLYWCDRLGLLVWGEMPSAYAYSTITAARLTREWLEIVRRDRSHPCIVDLGAPQRELGNPDGRARPRPAPLRLRALPPDPGPGSHPARDQQRRMGAHGQRHLGRPRLRAQRRGAAGPVRNSRRCAPQPQGGSTGPTSCPSRGGHRPRSAGRHHRVRRPLLHPVRRRGMVRLLHRRHP